MGLEFIAVLLLSYCGFFFVIGYRISFWVSRFSGSVMSKPLHTHGLQHARLPCPSPTPGAYSNSCPSIESVMPSNHLILCHPLLLLPSIFPSTRVFSNESALCIRWPKYWSFSFSISPSSEYPGLISFRINWFDVLQSKGLSRVFSYERACEMLLGTKET